MARLNEAATFKDDDRFTNDRPADSQLFGKLALGRQSPADGIYAGLDRLLER